MGSLIALGAWLGAYFAPLWRFACRAASTAAEATSLLRFHSARLSGTGAVASGFFMAEDDTAGAPVGDRGTPAATTRIEAKAAPFAAVEFVLVPN